MPRKKIIKSSIHPYHITNRYNNREFFPLPMETLWHIFRNELREISKRHCVNIHAFVLMSNHYHLIIDTPLMNISDAMAYFGSQITRKANASAQRINHFFGGRYKWKLIETQEYYDACIYYVFNNPVTAGLSAQVTDYKYSSINDSTDKFLYRTGNIYGKLHQINDTYNSLNRKDYTPEELQLVKKYLNH